MVGFISFALIVGLVENKLVVERRQRRREERKKEGMLLCDDVSLQ